MPTARSLDGNWVGEYFPHDRPHAITAELVQSGEALTGLMRDGEPDQEMSVTEVASASGDGPGADEQIVARLRELFPDEPATSIRYVSHLPTGSTLECRVRGAGVYLRKSYQGTSFGGFKVGDRIVGQRVEGHSVHYSGRLGPDGDEIQGRWWIDPIPESGGRRTEVSFTLRRWREEARESARAASVRE